MNKVNAWGVQVQTVSLGDLDVSAEHPLGMVIVQSSFELVADSTVPMRIDPAHRDGQVALIERAFQIRQTETLERKLPIPFVLFPELSIPVRYPDGLEAIKQHLSGAHGDLVFVGGLEGQSPAEVHELVDRFGLSADPAQPAYAAGAFINLCVVAIKSGGRLDWHFQAKLRPSQWEQPRNMAYGQRVLYFVGKKISFVCLICFDHLASQGQEPLNSMLCKELVGAMQPNVAALDFLFVPQFNPKPTDASQRQNTQHLLSYQDRAFKNDMTTVVIINKAAAEQESTEFGRSGFHFKAGRWQIPEKDLGPKGYELTDSDGVTSAVFRKRTQAVHVTALVPLSYNVRDSGNPRQPLHNPRSYLIGDSCDPTMCSCLPARCVRVVVASGWVV